MHAPHALALRLGAARRYVFADGTSFLPVLRERTDLWYANPTSGTIPIMLAVRCKECGAVGPLRSATTRSRCACVESAHGPAVRREVSACIRRRNEPRLRVLEASIRSNPARVNACGLMATNRTSWSSGNAVE